MGKLRRIVLVKEIRAFITLGLLGELSKIDGIFACLRHVCSH